MKELLYDLFIGTVSRRKFIERASAAGLALPIIGSGLMKSANAQGSKKPKPKTETVEQENPVYSPANIGGGGRIERNFYRDWIKHTKTPRYHNPHGGFDVVTHEVQPWSAIERRGTDLNLTSHL